jgi:hypothetical protein
VPGVGSGEERQGAWNSESKGVLVSQPNAVPGSRCAPSKAGSLTPRHELRPTPAFRELLLVGVFGRGFVGCLALALVEIPVHACVESQDIGLELPALA